MDFDTGNTERFGLIFFDNMCKESNSKKLHYSFFIDFYIKIKADQI